MKLLIILLAIFFCGISLKAQDKPKSKTKTVVARYDGNSTDSFMFTNDLNNAELKISAMTEEIQKKYDFLTAKFLGSYFRLTYVTDYVENTENITNQKLIATRNPYKKVLTIIEMDFLKDYKDE